MATQVDVARCNAFWRQLVSFSSGRVEGTCSDLRDNGAESVASTLLSTFTELQAKNFNQCCVLAESVRQATWEKRPLQNKSAYGGGGSQWQHVSWREAYVFSLLFLACGYLCQETPDYTGAMLSLDTVVILSGMLPPVRSMTQYCDAHLRSKRSESFDVLDTPDKWAIGDKLPATTPNITFPIVRKDSPSLEEFTVHVQNGRPLILSSIIQDWPAIERWRDLRYFLDNFGHRYIPVEIGRHGESVWREEVMPMSRLLNEYLMSTAAVTSLRHEDIPLESIAYLAQHPLFEHLTTLRHDIAIPPYVRAFLSTDEPHINAWVGTAGTVTPLHTDTYDNILAQVVGFKYVRLYTADQTPRLYVDNSDGARGNMSLVPCEREDFENQPLAQNAQYTEAILGPGDCLFIPGGCWHYVRSLTSSISVNFWFT